MKKKIVSLMMATTLVAGLLLRYPVHKLFAVKMHVGQRDLLRRHRGKPSCSSEYPSLHQQCEAWILRHGQEACHTDQVLPGCDLPEIKHAKYISALACRCCVRHPLHTAISVVRCVKQVQIRPPRVDLESKDLERVPGVLLSNSRNKNLSVCLRSCKR